MKATITQAIRNERNLRQEMTGYGHWRISMDYRGRRISTVTTDAPAIDDFFNCEDDDKQDGCNRRKRGYEDLCNEIIRANYE
jgi:hypothetical protein